MVKKIRLDREVIFMQKKIFWLFLILILIIVNGNILAFTLETEIESNLLTPLQEVNVKVKLLDDDGQLIKEDKQLLVQVSRGGLSELKNLREGIPLKKGIANFTYLAPEKAGNAEIMILELQEKLKAKINFEIKESSEQKKWKEEYALLKDIKGNVFLKYKNAVSWESANNELKIHKGDKIKTQNNSWVTLQLFDGSEIVLEPFSEMLIESLATLEGNSEVKQGKFELLKGKVLCSANKFINKGSSFTVETASATAGVRGTYFEVFYLENSGTFVILYRGSLHITQKDTELSYKLKGQQKTVIPRGEITPLIFENTDSEEERKEELKKIIEEFTKDEGNEEENDNDNNESDDEQNNNNDELDESEENEEDDDNNNNDNKSAKVIISPVW